MSFKGRKTKYRLLRCKCAQEAGKTELAPSYLFFGYILRSGSIRLKRPVFFMYTWAVSILWEGGRFSL